MTEEEGSNPGKSEVLIPYLITDAFDSVEDDGAMAAFHVVEAVGSSVEAKGAEGSDFGNVEEGARVRDPGIAHAPEAHDRRRESEGREINTEEEEEQGL